MKLAFYFIYSFIYFSFVGDSQEDSVTVVLHKQPAGGVHQSSVCQLLQPRALPCSQPTASGALGWLLHPLEPSHETAGVLKMLKYFLANVHTIHILCICPIIGTCSSAL